MDEDLNKREDSKGNAQNYKSERFEVFIGGVLSALNGTIDTNKYEDFGRIMFGGKAYMLFSFDKLIISVQLTLFYSNLYSVLNK